MRILVTGGTGYLGSVLLPKLFPICHRLDVLDSRAPSAQLQPVFASDKVHHYRESSDVVYRDYELIVHLTGQVGFPACERSPERARERNVDAMETVLRGRNPRAGVLFASTTSVYGAQSSQVPVGETAYLRPTSLYGVTKKTAEERLQQEKNWTILRFASGFGVSPHMRHDNLIHDFTRRAVAGLPLDLYEPRFTRQFVHVQDMADALVFAVRSWDRVVNQIFNVGNPGLQMAKSALVRALQKVVPLQVREATGSHDHDSRNYPVSFNKFTKFGFTPRLGLDQTVRELAQYYSLNPSELENDRVPSTLKRTPSAA